MPIYEYQCKRCGEVTESLQKMSDPPLKKCPECGGKVSKLMSMNTFHLKGSGWYVTDYAGKKAPKTETAEKTDKSDKAQKSDTNGAKDKSTTSSTKKD